ncbi:DUF4145 domain-containing protein [Achromobacter dolens]|uniref:DUF4145 domain-containing protein n=1 Tax=Achromobacter dolens TaxID=1287738 RepID=UPI0011AA98B8|nr:DUF4145 domain-containing protein [Achromobacter dolens]
MIEPKYSLQAFNCPHCFAHAQMNWSLLYAVNRGTREETELVVARCGVCRDVSIWRDDSRTAPEDYPAADTPPTMLWPNVVTAPAPHPYLPDSIRADFEEARQISALSPRAAAALLRLCVQKLCIELKLPGKNINDDIGALVKQGLPIAVQRALDVLRVVGNNAVHPGAMSQDDHASQVTALFGLVNIVVQHMIAQPKEIEAMYALLPQGALKAIENRDA